MNVEGSVWDAEKRSKCKNLYLKGIRDGKVQEHNDLDGKIMEHWSNKEPVPARQELINSGKS